MKRCAFIAWVWFLALEVQPTSAKGCREGAGKCTRRDTQSVGLVQSRAVVGKEVHGEESDAIAEEDAAEEGDTQSVGLMQTRPDLRTRVLGEESDAIAEGDAAEEGDEKDMGNTDGIAIAVDQSAAEGNEKDMGNTGVINSIEILDFGIKDTFIVPPLDYDVTVGGETVHVHEDQTTVHEVLRNQ